MQIRVAIIACLISATASAAVTRYYFPSIQTEIKTVDHDIIHNNIVTVTHTVKEPNGTVDTTTTTTDHTQQIDTHSNTEITVKPLEWNISGLMATDTTKNLAAIYGVSVTRQILGPITIGAFGLSNSVVGVSIGLNF